MTWLAPAAFWGLAAIVLPVVVHLLRRRRSRAIVVPTVRFISPVSDSTVRVRPPSDPLLLAIRIAIIACAALAWALPVFRSDARLAAWNSRVSRAVVVHREPSMPSAALDRIASAEIAAAFVSRTFDGEDIGNDVRRGSAWLDRAPSGIREVVVISQFRRGVVDARDVERLGEGQGLRLIVAPRPETRGSKTFDGSMLRFAGAAWRQRITTDADGTSVAYLPTRATPLFTRADSESRSVIEQVLNDVGVHMPAGSDARLSITKNTNGGGHAVQIAGIPASAAHQLLETVTGDWSFRRSGNGFDVLIPAEPLSPEVLTAVKTVIDAEREPFGSHETQFIDEATLRSWSRPSTRVPFTPQGDDHDAGVVWIVIAVLLAVEWLVRKRMAADVGNSYRHAA